MLALFLKEINTPDAGATWYFAALIALGHVFLGASLVYFMPVVFAMALRLLIPVFYWVLKEAGDLRRGGSFKDGLLDTLFVGIGSFYGDPYWLPVVIAGVTGVALRRLWDATK